ncbi:hypothetical protein BH695_0900 [Microcystis aeruginosa PCC 7806SL]|uniref:Uncharacterized protein n=1 Tax=Microcystis aeruginosa PCC 7806SL TaxID=1903187 RepID=A0AB33BU14_MICA7|nr:hypothetical protein BH695_0900 [Microcystis aeruginosa PCC 7806SL]
MCAGGVMACSVRVLGIKDCCTMMIKKICSQLKSEQQSLSDLP